MKKGRKAGASRPTFRERLKNLRAGDYTRQLSVVIIGIMITFVGGDLVSRYSRARQLKSMMQLVAAELESNRATLREVCDYLRYDRRGMLLLAEGDYDVDALPLDSLRRYRSVMGRTRDLRVRSDALEVLKSSGTITSIGDKQMLLDLLRCYNELEGFASDVVEYNGRKKQAIDHLFENIEQGRLRRFFDVAEHPGEWWREMLRDPMCLSFLASSAYFFGDDEFYDSDIAGVERTLASVKRKYGLQ